VAEVLKEHVELEVESIDRMYLNVFVPRLQIVEGTLHFIRHQCQSKVLSPTAVEPMTCGFVRAIEQYAQCPLIGSLPQRRRFAAVGLIPKGRRFKSFPRNRKPVGKAIATWPFLLDLRSRACLRSFEHQIGCKKR
jgi:hypothetical protein